MSDSNNIKKLKTTPVAELNLGTARLRRVIQRATFETLPELLELSEDEIDELFEWEVADAVIQMKEKYVANPDAFAAKVLQKKEIDRDAIEKTLSKARASRVSARTARPAATLRACYPDDAPASLPPAPFSDDLKGFEKRAREAFDDLDDRSGDVMVYQAFEEFSTDLDELSSAFGHLFSYYSAQPRAALNLIDRYLGNAFVVYVADRARNVYGDGNLWGNFFNGLGIQDSNVQALFKQTFVSHIERRKMPLYARDEEANYYFYTALLHGGLSSDSWVNLWEKSILPLAKEIAAGHYGFGGEMDGHSILKELKNPESRFAPKKAVLNILDKAPDPTIAPLFEASMRVATQVESAKKSKSGYTMLSNFGLPDAAMEALRETQEQVSHQLPSPARAVRQTVVRKTGSAWYTCPWRACSLIWRRALSQSAGLASSSLYILRGLGSTTTSTARRNRALASMSVSGSAYSRRRASALSRRRDTISSSSSCKKTNTQANIRKSVRCVRPSREASPAVSSS